MASAAEISVGGSGKKPLSPAIGPTAEITRFSNAVWMSGLLGWRPQGSEFGQGPGKSKLDKDLL